MSRRIDIELTSTRDDGSWTWRAAGAREPKGTLEGAILPTGASVGDVVKAEIEGYLDGLSVVAIVPPRAPRAEPERIELRARRDDTPLVTADVRKRSSERPRRGERGRRGRDEGERPRRERDRDRDRQTGRHERARPDRGERATRPASTPAEAKPKPKRLRPGRTHRAALLESLPTEQRPIAEQLLQGGIPAVRQAIDKQNEALKAEGKPEVGRDPLLKVAEDIRPRALAALWRDRAEAAVATVDDLDLRDLRSVVNAAGDAGRDEEPRALAAQLREALANRVEKEHAAWLADLADTLRDGRVVRALRLSSRPPKAGAPIPTDLTNQLTAAAAAALTEETGQDRWATVLDALAYSPVRRRVIPQSLPTKLSPALRETVARLGNRLPEIAHIFAIEPEEPSGRPTGARPRRRQRGTDDRPGAASGGGRRGRGPRSQAKPSRSSQGDAGAVGPSKARAAPDAAPAEAEGRSVAPEAGPADAPSPAETTVETGAPVPAPPVTEPEAAVAEPPVTAGESGGVAAEAETARPENIPSGAETSTEAATGETVEPPRSTASPSEEGAPGDTSAPAGENGGGSHVIEAGTMPADRPAR